MRLRSSFALGSTLGAAAALPPAAGGTAPGAVSCWRATARLATPSTAAAPPITAHLLRLVIAGPPLFRWMRDGRGQSGRMCTRCWCLGRVLTLRVRLAPTATCGDAGKRTVKVLPRPWPSLCASTVPPWSSVSMRTSERPRPSPPCERSEPRGVVGGVGEEVAHDLCQTYLVRIDGEPFGGSGNA